MIEPSPTAHQVATVQTELCAALGLPSEQFPLSAVISMVSDEIEQLRLRGSTDAEIARLIQWGGGVAVPADEIARHYALPAARGQPV